MSFARGSLVYADEGQVAIECLKPGQTVFKRGRTRWLPATVKSVHWTKVSRTKTVVSVEDPKITMTVSDDGQFTPGCGDFVMCSEGEHVFIRQISVVELARYLEPLDLVDLELDKPSSLVVNGFLVTV